MKSNYFLNVELTSNRKFTPSDIVDIKDSLELNEDFFGLCMLFSESLSINFSGHLEIYIEDQPFENDILSEVEDLILNIDSLIPGGWESDSKVEWSTESVPGPTHVWFKDSDRWEVLVKDHDRGFLGEDEEWDDDHDSSYNDDLGFDDNEW
jgi:hypothetical protein